MLVAVFFAVTAVSLTLFSNHFEPQAQAAEPKPQDVTVPVKPAKTGAKNHGKNVNAEPSGIALSVDSIAADAPDSLVKKLKKPDVSESAPASTKKIQTASAAKISKPVEKKTKAAPAPKKASDPDDLLEAGKYEEALALYDQALQKDGNDQDAWEGKARALQEMSSADSVHQLREMITARPQSGIAHAALAQALVSQGENYAALESWKRASELDPSNKNYLLNLAVLNDRVGNDSEAIELYKKLGDQLPYAAKKRLDYLLSRTAQ